MVKNDLGHGIERTFAMVKPDGVQRGLVGEIISRIEKRGLQIVALKMVRPSVEHMTNHYPTDDEWVKRLGQKGKTVFDEQGIDMKEAMGTDDLFEAGKLVRGWLIDFMTSAPVVAMVVEGVQAIEMVRKIAGPTLPAKAEIGTIRGDFSTDSPVAANLNKRPIKNLIHISENKEEAEHEIGHWFAQEEIFDYDRPEHQAMY